MTERMVAVIGASECDDEVYGRAREVGRLLAERGSVVVCGGLGGVMEAACRGAQEAGGTALGILPGPDVRAANPYVTVAVATGLGEARNAVIANTGEAFIAVSGSWGTLSEIAFARRLGKPVVSLGSWQPDASVQTAQTAAEAVALALGGRPR
jgi:uncharacterized protein (TIGR00725 family)